MALGRGNIEIDIRGRVDTAGIARQVQTAEKQIRPLNVSLNNEGFRQPLGQISGDLAEFQKSLDASVARTLAFGAAVGVINAVSNGFKALIVSATEVEKALTDVNVILNLNGSALQQFSDQLFDVAKNTGQSFQTVSEAAVELSRQGLGAEETLSRINDAMILTRLSGMDAAKSVETLTAAVNSFGSAALTTTDLVNKLATVDAAFAVSTEDLANGLARSGATAQAAKVDLNELLAAITSVQQTTARGGAVIGNAFKSIFTRIQRSGVR
jgi:TP901 family phage tail tape measure protein